MNPQFAHHAGTDPGEDQVLPCPHALIASTLALMTTWADPAPGCALDVLSLRAGLRYEGDRFDDDLNARELSAATEVDLRADWSVSRAVTLYAAAENLFDAKIETAQTGDGLESYDQPRTLRVGAILRR